MTPQTRTSLKELQQLDQEIAAIRSATQSFEPLLEEVDGPVLRLEEEVKALENRLKDIRLEENRIELTIEERRVRVSKLQERMEAVRNVREEAAVDAELEMVRRALESEEQEALSLLDQIKRLEERLEEQKEAYAEALAEVEPRRKELVEEQRSTEGKLEGLLADRETFAAGIDPGERRIYDSIMAGSRDVAVAELTQDGACGNCYNMVPLQIQNQIRHGDGMFRCEGCGVILTPESAEGLARAQEEGERIERALKASTDQRDEERVALSEVIALEEEEEAAAADTIASEAGTAEAPAPAAEDPAPEVGSALGGLFGTEVAIENVATDDAPAEEQVVEDAATDDASAEEQVVEDTATDDASAEEQAVEDAATDDAPAEEQAVEDAATDDAPAEEQEVEDVATDDAPAEEQAVEDTATDDAPAEEQAVEDVATDDAPAEEQPVEDVATDDVAAEEQAVEEADATEVADTDIVAEGAEPREPTANS